MELNNFVINAEQNRAACDSPDFYCRRLEEYQHTLSVLTRRITESYHTEQELISNLEVPLNCLNTLRNQFKTLSEIFDRTCAQNLLQESYDQSICLPEYNGGVGRPRIHVTQEQLNILHNSQYSCLSMGWYWKNLGSQNELLDGVGISLGLQLVEKLHSATSLTTIWTTLFVKY
jgi:hypothetical protein